MGPERSAFAVEHPIALPGQNQNQLKIENNPLGDHQPILPMGNADDRVDLLRSKDVDGSSGHATEGTKALHARLQKGTGYRARCAHAAETYPAELTTQAEVHALGKLS